MNTLTEATKVPRFHLDLTENINSRVKDILPHLKKYQIELVTLGIVSAVEYVLRTSGIAEGFYMHIVGGVIIGGLMAGPKHQIEK